MMRQHNRGTEAQPALPLHVALVANVADCFLYLRHLFRLDMRQGMSLSSKQSTRDKLKTCMFYFGNERDAAVAANDAKDNNKTGRKPWAHWGGNMRSLRGIDNGNFPIPIDFEIKHEPIAAFDLKTTSQHASGGNGGDKTHLAVPAHNERDRILLDAVQGDRRFGLLDGARRVRMHFVPKEE
jgi:hypothetical protein